MIRLFAIYETAVSQVALKLASGASYRNGNNPVILSPCVSMQDAYSKMLSLNRRRNLQYLKWTLISDLNNSIQHVLSITDSFFVNIQNHSIVINEMRVVRNHVAHRNNSTSNQFKQELRRLYGGNPRLSMGAFLVSTNRHNISNISRYIQTMRIILADITHG